MGMETGTNTLYSEVKCPHCGYAVKSGIGFRAGSLKQISYKLGEKLSWDGTKCRPAQRPPGGNLKTVGYFECDNLDCPTWQDCYPEVQEALITIQADIISDVKPFIHRPNELVFDIIEPKDVT